jgi:2-amino-4-hydroxy-6-hydroxymethyldihydropteridine diphosphokinase
VTILIAIGANLPGPEGQPPIQNCRDAVPLLCAIPGLAFVALSSWYRSVAQPRADQPDYCNGVIRLSGYVDPAGLLARLHEIEALFGRERTVTNAARSLDLDIIDLNGMIRAVPAPVLPHPRAHLRAFVLRPILDVAPGWRHPILQQNVSTMLAELSPQGIRPWDEDGVEAPG